MKASERGADPKRHTAAHCAQIIRAGDSQPGVQVKWFDYDHGLKSLFVYGAWIENDDLPASVSPNGWDAFEAGRIVATRQGAVLVKTAASCSEFDDDERGIWITHARTPMSKETKLLPPKLPAVDAIKSAGLGHHLDNVPEWNIESGWTLQNGVAGRKTWQQLWVETEQLPGLEGGQVLYVHFDF